MSVVRSLAVCFVATALFGFATAAEGAPFRPTYWRLTGSWTAKKDASPPASASTSSSPFARLFDRPNADITTSSPTPITNPAPPPPPPPPATSSAPPSQSSPSYSTSAPSYGAYGLIPPTPVAPPRAEYDAFINFGGGPYRGEDILTTGTASPWHSSSIVRRFFDGGTPSSEQQAQFIGDVVAQVSKTYQRAGLDLDLTTDPNVHAAHTMSVVSNTHFPAGPQAVGIAAMGYYGFSFIDKFGSVPTLEQLKTAVAHNIAHEMMHTFGVDHLDKTGKYLDAAVTSWDIMVDPNAEFSADAIRELQAKDFKVTGMPLLSEVQGGEPEGQIVCQHCLQAMNSLGDHQHEIAASIVLPVPVPEPSSLLGWSAIALVGALAASRHRRRD